MSGRFEIVDPPALTKLLARHQYTLENYAVVSKWDNTHYAQAILATCAECGDEQRASAKADGKPTARMRQATKDHIEQIRWGSHLVRLIEFPEPALTKEEAK